MSNLVYVVGARPNFVKMAPVIAALREKLPEGIHVVVHTGQHYDRELSAIFFEELQLPSPDYLLRIGSGRHGAQIARALTGIEQILNDHPIDIIVVAGDVNSTLAGALAGVKCGVPVAHVEAGLRSFDRSMPEEINRILVDQISRWCFTHSPEAEVNLAREGIPSDWVHAVGNTMIDTLVRMRSRAAESGIHDRLSIQPGGYLLVTLHRPSLVDGALLLPALERLRRLALTVPVVFPVHPRTRAKIPQGFRAPGLRLIDPIGYIDFVALEMHATAVVTDSGGVQEETTFLGVPCFTLRTNTERPITIVQGTNTLLGLDPDAIERIPELLLAKRETHDPPAGWDGRAARRLADVIATALADVDPSHRTLPLCLRDAG